MTIQYVEDVHEVQDVLNAKNLQYVQSAPDVQMFSSFKVSSVCNFT